MTLACGFSRDSCVTQLRTESNGHVVETAQGNVRARFVVLACNTHVGSLAPDLARKIMPVGTYVIATEPLDPDRAEALMARARCGVRQPLRARTTSRPTPDNRLLWGGKVSYSTFAPRNLGEAMRHDMLKDFPATGRCENRLCVGRFRRYYDEPRRRISAACRRTVYFAQGFSGHGVNTTGLAGKLIAEAIDSQAARFDLFDKIRHRDFPGGATLRTPALPCSRWRGIE